MAEIVYLLCAITCLACALLLWRGYRRSHARLLWWSALCFAILTLNNGLLVLDLAVYTSGPDLSLWRSTTGTLAIACLLYGLIWDVQ